MKAPVAPNDGSEHDGCAETAIALPLETLPDAAVLVDSRGRIRAVNTAAANLFGYRLEQLMGRSSDELVSGIACEKHRQRRGDYLAAPRRLNSVVASVGLRADGSEFPIEIAVAPLVESSETLVIATIRDVSLHAKLEAGLRDRMSAIERTAAARDRFFATMSHDLRAPLNAIIGFAGTLLMKLPGPLNEAQEHQLGIIRSSGQQLLALLNDVIDLAKMESGLAAPRRESFNLAAMLEEVATRLRYRAERKQVMLETQLSDAVPIVADRRAIQQIVYQLLDNAIKFTSSGAVNLRLGTLKREGRGWIEISVSDTGAALVAADRDGLREAFRDPDCPIRVGNGLGLHMARKFAQLIGGCLELESEPGTGSRFALLIPQE